MLAALVASPLSAPASAGVHGGPTLSPAGGPGFPERSFVLTLPQRLELTGGAVRVTENGRPVPRFGLAPVGAKRRARLGVVLAIDASGSMRGQPIAGAFAAGRAFARQRNEDQPLGVITFNGTSRTALSFTTDPVTIRRALSRPPSANGGTRLYDAAFEGIETLREADLPGGFVVVLSDGTDHGSHSGVRAVTAAARAAHVRIYTVGLESGRFDPDALRRLAESTGGSFSEASSATELRGIYSALGAELSNAYVLRYRSPATPSTRVQVRVAVSGIGTASATYTTPRLRSDRVVPAAPAGGLASTTAIWLAAALAALLVGVLTAAVLTRRRQSPRERVAQFVSDRSTPSQPLTERLARGTEESLSGTRWWPDFERSVEVGGLPWTPAKLVVATGGLALAAGLLLGLASGQPLAVVPVLALAPVGLRAFVTARAERERRRFSDQLADHLAVVGGAMRAGHSLPAAFAAVLEEAPEPSRREFARANADERLGAPLEDALEKVAQRMESRDVEQVALLARVQREAGADAAEMLDRVVETIRERQELRRTVRTLTAQGRLSRWILSLLPVVVAVGLTLTNRDYIEPLYGTGLGRGLVMAAAAMVVAGSLVIKRIVNFQI